MRHIIDDINASIAENLLPSLNIKTYGVAESVSVRGDDNVTLPAMVFPDGECVSVFSEVDMHDIVLYHRLQDIAYQEDARMSFGSRSDTYTQTADMALIVFGKRHSMNQFLVERAARDAIVANGGALARSDFNALQVFAAEYAGVTYFLGTDYYLFKINYTLTSTYNARCNK